LPFKDKKKAKEYFTNYNHNRALLMKEALQALKEKREKEGSS
jgi:hypothetical protein